MQPFFEPFRFYLARGAFRRATNRLAGPLPLESKRRRRPILAWNNLHGVFRISLLALLRSDSPIVFRRGLVFPPDVPRRLAFGSPRHTKKTASEKLLGRSPLAPPRIRHLLLGICRFDALESDSLKMKKTKLDLAFPEQKHYELFLIAPAPHFWKIKPRIFSRYLAIVVRFVLLFQYNLMFSAPILLVFTENPLF
jgi:hypothetical protein